MAKSDASAAARPGGRYYRDPQTGAVVPEADYHRPTPEPTEEPETPAAPVAPAKRKGN
ncbi:hypothetical protein [Phyllobacterium phragmitis]|uniref:hypothetical protein n=1 Tax=Phyllobacterium phragmitis TaxID=2670329 RepID=UPI001304B0DB|nr:hypothetical protein [Phyllobacterium phragmitis]